MSADKQVPVTLTVGTITETIGWIDRARLADNAGLAIATFLRASADRYQAAGHQLARGQTEETTP